MKVTYIILLVAGLAMTSWGLPASYKLRSPWHILAALTAMAGVITSLLAVLILTVPNFFSR